jgi:hypothetical protein
MNELQFTIKRGDVEKRINAKSVSGSYNPGELFIELSPAQVNNINKHFKIDSDTLVITCHNDICFIKEISTRRNGNLSMVIQVKPATAHERWQAQQKAKELRLKRAEASIQARAEAEAQTQRDTEAQAQEITLQFQAVTKMGSMVNASFKIDINCSMAQVENLLRDSGYIQYRVIGMDKMIKLTGNIDK